MKSLIAFVLILASPFFLKAQCLQHSSSSLSQPISIMGAHVHKKGSFMGSFQSGFMSMKGMKEENRLLTESDLSNRYMMYGKKMNMSMHMFMTMYGVSDRFNIMVMGHYMSCNMTMTHNMGTMQHEMSSQANGFGDLRISGLYELLDAENIQLIAQIGASIPTGSIENRNQISNNPHNKLGYAMQFGSGTYDCFSSLSFTRTLPAYSIGLQGFALLRNGVNDQGYTLGNQFTTSVWAGKRVLDGLVIGVNINAQSFGSIAGLDAEMDRMSISGNPQNSGYQRVVSSAYFGYSPFEKYAVTINGEVSVPIYENVEGIQMSLNQVFTVGVKFSI
ncbi:MAG: hypothetical protein JXQ87_02625 [Bacteroidia bacterium]